jgi:hypothetical protein
MRKNLHIWAEIAHISFISYDYKNGALAPFKPYTLPPQAAEAAEAAPTAAEAAPEWEARAAEAAAAPEWEAEAAEAEAAKPEAAASEAGQGRDHCCRYRGDSCRTYCQ